MAEQKTNMTDEQLAQELRKSKGGKLGGKILLLLGVVIHNLTRNENLAYGVTLVLIAALSVAYFVNSSAFKGLLPDIMTKLSLFRQFNSFVNGAFDLTAIVYYVSVMGFFLFLSVQSMEKRRYN